MNYSRRDFFRRGLLDSMIEAVRAAPRADELRPLLVDPERCYSAMNCPCEICVERCPHEARPIRVELGRPPIVGAQCDGCGACAWYCPADALQAKQNHEPE